MKAVTIYQTDDGARFDDPAKAHRHEALDVVISTIENKLPQKPSDPDKRIKVDSEDLEWAKDAVVKICRAEFPKESVFAHDPQQIHPMSYAGRFLSEHGGPIDRIWRYFACVGDDGYLYQQPFFALNPEKFRGAK